MSSRSHWSIKVLESALSGKGYIFKYVRLGADGTEFVQICRPEQTSLLTIRSAYPHYPFPTHTETMLSIDKSVAYDFVERNGVSVPRSMVVQLHDNVAIATNFLALHKRVIVKPVDSRGARGLTLDVTNESELGAAIRAARRESDEVFVQRQYFGEEVRFAVINGKAKVALLRETPKVTGDGKHSIRELIQQENESRALVQGSMIMYPQLTEELIGPKLKDEKVLDAGEMYELSKSTMIKGGASIYDVTKKIDKSYLVAAEQAAKGIGNGFVVVDMLIQDYRQPANEENFVFLEFNLSPALALFYSCRDEKDAPIVERYLVPMIERALELCAE